ncbi:hypothetical protein SAMN02910456_01459 [Ruminococcaceae bacterium YRB3002]|nr:hypothetical protein SAMN02910456_01459 [Ruminococcaceae bacterium YRB3002]
MLEELELTGLFDADDYNGLEEMFDNWMNEWEYPNIGKPERVNGSEQDDI